MRNPPPAGFRVRIRAVPKPNVPIAIVGRMEGNPPKLAITLERPETSEVERVRTTMGDPSLPGGRRNLLIQQYRVLEALAHKRAEEAEIARMRQEASKMLGATWIFARADAEVLLAHIDYLSTLLTELAGNDHAPGVRRLYFCFFAPSGFLYQIERLLCCEFRANVCPSRKTWKRPPFARHGCPEIFRDVDGPRGEQPHVQVPAALFSVQASILHLGAGVSMPMRYP